MPRKIPRGLPIRKKIEPVYEGDEEITEEEMNEELEQEEPVRLPPMPKPPRPTQRFQPKQVQPTAPKPRYSGFAQQAAEGVIDTETQEVIASDIWVAFANVIERLERIENSIGSMLGN